MAVTSFEVDEHTLATIASLKAIFGEKSNAGVIRKALALAKIASRHATANKTIVISGESKSPGETVCLG